jgi:hypothetical protein
LGKSRNTHQNPSILQDSIDDAEEFAGGGIDSLTCAARMFDASASISKYVQKPYYKFTIDQLILTLNTRI